MHIRKFNLIIALFVIVFVFNPVKIWGQDIVNLSHIVTRGETIEILADKYKLTTEILKFVNLGMDDFYTGMKVFVPVDKKYLRQRSEEESEKILDDIAGYFLEYQEASRVFNSGDYKKADKLFETTIRNYGRFLPCEEAYFGKAMCDFNRKKWSSAIDGFSLVVNMEECPEELKEQCRSLMANAEEQREARNQRTANFFNGLFQAAAEVGVVYMAASQANAAQANYNNPSMSQVGVSLGSMSNAEFTNYVNTNLAQIANYSVLQVQQQWRQEEIQVKSNFTTSYRLLHGKDPSAAEVQAAYNNHIQNKVNAYKTVQLASSGIYDRELGIDNNDNKVKKKTASGFYCSVCRDSHKCQTCNGSGWQHSELGDIHDRYGAGIGQFPCGNCSDGHSKGDGVCHFCK